MAGGKLRRITKPEVLRQITPGRLLSLLAEFEAHFTDANYPLPADASEFDIERLAVVLSDAQRNAPQELLDAFFLIDQMATAGGRDAVKRVLGEFVNQWMRSRGFVLGADEAELATGGLWDWLERPDSWLATTVEWQSRLGDQYPVVAPFLARMQVCADHIQLDGEPNGRDVVADAAGGFLAVSAATGTQTAVDATDVALWSVDIAAVARSVSEAFGFLGTVCPIDDSPDAWSLGEFAPIEGERFPAYLVAAPDDETLRETCLVLAGVSTRSFVLVTPTRKHSTPKLNDRLGAAGSGWLALSERTRLHAEGRIKPRHSVDNLLRQFLSIHLPQHFGQPSRPRFATPVGAEWSDITIRFLDGHTVSVSAKGVSATLSYEGMGMADKRTPRPTEQWKLLHNFARDGGVLTWKSSASTRRNQKRRERLADDLRCFFGIDVDPFEYDDNLKGWRALFLIEPD